MKLKKLILSIAIICMMMLIMPVSAKAEGVVGDASSTVIGYPSGTCGANATWVCNTDTKTLTISGTGATYGYSSVSDIPWKSYKSQIEKVVVKEGITEIGYGNFSNYGYILSVELPDTLKTIGYNAFMNCIAMTDINIPESVTSIGNQSFSGCYGLTSIELPSNLTSIANYTFYQSGLVNVYIPESVTSIGKRAFGGCNSLAYVELPSALKTIGENAFECCNALTSLNIPSSVTSIEGGAFASCTGLSAIYFDGNCPTISSTAFSKVTAGVYYYKSNTSWTTSKLQNYGGTITWHGLESIADKTATLSYTSTTYTGAERKPTVTIDGLTSGTDFTVSYSNNVKAGTATVTIRGNGDYFGSITKTFTIKPMSSSKLTATLSSTKWAYSQGAVKTPKVTVKNASGKTLTKGTDYTLTYASGRKNVGKYWVKVTCKGNYSGTITKYFTIIPNPTYIKSLSKASKAFTVKWAKESPQVTGYQIQYCTSKSFSSGVKSKYITSYKTTSKKITGLKSKKTYYVRIRTYKTVSGTKYYSSWSSIKNVKTK